MSTWGCHDTNVKKLSSQRECTNRFTITMTDIFEISEVFHSKLSHMATPAHVVEWYLHKPACDRGDDHFVDPWIDPGLLPDGMLNQWRLEWRVISLYCDCPVSMFLCRWFVWFLLSLCTGCSADSVICNSTGQCIKQCSVCDGQCDCQDCGDEDNCPFSRECNCSTVRHYIKV